MKNKDIYSGLTALFFIGVIGYIFDVLGRLESFIYIKDRKNAKIEKERKETYKFWKYFNLVSQDQAPVKKSKSTVPHGTSYRYEPPIGVGSNKFNGKNLELKEYTKADNVSIKYDNGDIVIDLYHAKDADINNLE